MTRILLSLLLLASSVAQAHLPNCRDFWHTNHEPAVDVAATITKAAVTNKHLVIDCAIGTVANAAATSLVKLYLKEGSTIRLPIAAAAPANGTAGFGGCGLGIRMPISTAATLVFSAAGGSGSYETVYLSGCVE